MPTETYWVKRYNVPGPGTSFCNTCQVVALTLDDTHGTFVLLQVRYDSDWGDRSEKGTRHTGTFSVEGPFITCTAARLEHLDRSRDHELGTSTDDSTATASQETLSFFRRTAEEIVCAVDYAGLAGVCMSSRIAPQHSPV
jgi:hypothetical protein